MIDKDERKRREEGSVAITMFLLFVVMGTILLGIYQNLVDDYVWVSESMEEKQDHLSQVSVVEAMKGYYAEDMLWDGNGLDVGIDFRDKEHWGTGSEFRENNVEPFFDVYGVRKEGEVEGAIEEGEEAWNKWTRYDVLMEDNELGEGVGRGRGLDEDIPPGLEDKVGRSYGIKDNVERNGMGKLEVTNSSNEELLVPDKMYVKVEFDEDVNRVYFTVGNSFESETYDFVNRTGEDIFYLGEEVGEDVPNRINEIIMRGSDSLGSTSFSILTEKEVNVEVYSKDDVGRLEKGRRSFVDRFYVELTPEGNRIKEEAGE